MAKDRIGIMGGSFNPIHTRHIEIAESALKEGQLSRVLFIPTGNPPHKHEGLEAAEHRFEMTRLAVMNKHGFTASRIELDRAGLIYTVDTLALLQKQFPLAQLDYIIGEDTLLDLPNWRTPDKVFSLCRFLVCRRSTDDASAHPLLSSLEARGAKFLFLSLPPRELSATAIREELLRGETPQTLAPQVMEYIRIMGLYGLSPSPQEGQNVYPKLKQALSDKRFMHSLLVAATARHLAARHHLNADAAALAGLLHDCAKCFPLAQLQSIAKRYRLQLDRESMHNENLLHGPVGAAIAQSEYGVTDPCVLSAIACHTTGKVGMQPLDMVLFLADKIEPSRRSYPELERVRTLAETSLSAAMRYSLQSTLLYVSSQKVIPHPVTKNVACWLERMEDQEYQRSEMHE